MNVFDTLLIDPDRAGVEGALEAAIREANAVVTEEIPLLDWPPTHLPAVLDRCLRDAEGQDHWSNDPLTTRRVLLAWMPAEDGRKLVRVLGEPVKELFPKLKVRSEERSWPTEAIVYRHWAHVFQRSAESEPEVIVACDCGIIGRPAEIGWRDVRCGPCHDRLAEGVPLPELQRRFRRDLTLASNGYPVAIAPDGQRFVVACEPSLARITDLEWSQVGRTVTILDRLRYVAFSADHSRIVLLSGYGSRSRLQVCSYPGMAEGPIVDLNGNVHALALSPDGRVVCTAEYSGPTQRIDLDGDRVPVQLHAFRRARCNSVGALAISPDGVWLAGSADFFDIALLELETDTVQHLGRLGASPRSLVFTPDGGYLLAISDPRIEIVAVPSLESLGTFFTPLSGLLRGQLAGPWLVAFSAGTMRPTRFLPWEPLLDFVRRERGAP
jgi:hypothetical protein